ncbi:MGMT family protein [Nocardioides solisilvae]|uniref:MGMT family protein n=1 Tax=Nocardioides solisilvae TaxID=1542435 RepID=UPI001EF54D87|nr:MGMT family protein [Nocardioides solisilvae]
MTGGRVLDEAYVEAVLALVERVPPGRVVTYGLLADAVGRGGPRLVGRVMALHGGGVPWWRVVRADGRPADCHEGTAGRLLAAEGVPLRGSGRVDLPVAVWHPDAR